MEVNPIKLDGYVLLNEKSKVRLIEELENEYSNLAKAARELGFRKYHLYNFKKNTGSKLNTEIISKIFDYGWIDFEDIETFHDDKGSSSAPYTGDFPINYDPRWHFIYCLCIGDGHIRTQSTEQFAWHQKEKGTQEVVNLVKKLGFRYNPTYDCARHGITLPQLIPKTAKKALNIKSHSPEEIFNKTEKAGRDYKIALLTAFFVDEAGISTAKNSSEITIHQEGDLETLERYGELLNDFGIKWNRNKKREGWTIRITSEGVHKLEEIFRESKDLGIGLMHRKEAFDQKAKIASKTYGQTKLREDTSKVRKAITDLQEGSEINLDEIKSYFSTKKNLDRRAKELTRNLEKANKIKTTGENTFTVIS